MDLARDRRGRTEAEFLRDYDVTEYFRPSVTVDAVLYSRVADDTLKLLLIKRGGHPFIGKYAFPGGFVEAEESCETAAARELYEETGIADIPLRQLVTASTPGRDPRWRNITVVFCGELGGEVTACAGDDAAAAKWFTVRRSGQTLEFESEDEQFTCVLDIKRDAFGDIDLNRTEMIERGLTAFDHAKLIMYLFEKTTHR